MQKIPFAALGLSPEVLKAVAALGYEETSPIQAAAIPLLLEGQDIIGQSQTGSGKTAAFAIPTIEQIDPDTRHVQAIILCPTRELAAQVADDVRDLSSFKKGIFTAVIYGGSSYDRQLADLKKGAQVVIGTPGRLIDHLERGTLRLDSVKIAILDEADRMLDMGFRDDIRTILDATPKERQTICFSATISKPISDLIHRYAKDPQRIKIEHKEIAAPAIEQSFYETSPRSKLSALIRLIDYHDFHLGIIFCNTQHMVDTLADSLIAHGFSADRIHGGISQAQRTRVMQKFKRAEISFLVATDVAARGIDVDDLELVVNYDLPYDPEDYVHRIGRTGRAGKNGIALTLVSSREVSKLQYIERKIKVRIRRGQLPTHDEVEAQRTEKLLEKIREVITSKKALSHHQTIQSLVEEGLEAPDIASALLHLLKQDSDRPSPVSVDQDFSSEKENKRSRKESSPRDRKSRSSDERKERRENKEEQDSLKKPSRGYAWISLNVGRNEGFGPREIVDLIADVSGLPGKSVGTIEFIDNQTFVQMPNHFASGLSPKGNRIDFDGHPILLRPIQSKKFSRETKSTGYRRKSGTAKRREGKR